MRMQICRSASTWIICPLAFLFSAAVVDSVPLNIEGPSREVANNSLTDFDVSPISRGCRYKALFYGNGDEVSTDEPCLACQCKGTVVVCKLRICPEIPVPPPPGCIVVHKAKSCCSQLVCHHHHHGQDSPKKISREQRFPSNVSNATLLAAVSDSNETDKGFCILDGTVYAEGSAMRSSTLCQYCFCIRGEMKCSSPQCVIPLKGCKPRFRSYACCPTNYDCGQSNETAVLKTVPSSTQVPQFLKGCLVNGQFVPEGEPVLPVQIAGPGMGNLSSTTNVCQTCFCMGGVVHCRPLECDQPIDGCTPIKEDGHCCPDRYDCSKPQPELTKSTPRSLTTSSEGKTTTVEEAVTSRATTSQQTEPPVPVTTMFFTVEESAATTTTANNDDSFERVAMLTGGSSEETSSARTTNAARTRVTATTLGGFKNRSDLGSREERRSKDGDELSAKLSTEDDEKDDQNFPVFDTTVAFEDFGVTTFDESIGGPTTDSEIESEISVEVETTPINTFRMDNSTEGYTSFDTELTEATLPVNFDETSPPSVEHASFQVTTEVADSSESKSVDPIDTLSSSSTEHSLEHSTEKSSSSAPPEGTSHHVSFETTVSTTTQGSGLEYIPFVVEDAVMPLRNSSLMVKSGGAISLNPIAENHSESVPLVKDANASVLKPLELKFIDGTEASRVTEASHETESMESALPILVEKDDAHHPSSNVTVPISTSLYNNGYYPHGGIIQDDSSEQDLVIQEGELDEKTGDKLHESEDFFGSQPSYPQQPQQMTTEQGHRETFPNPPAHRTTPFTTRRPDHPLKSVSSNDKFIPSFSPPTIQHNPVSPANPSRTYSKFGMQDSPMYRFDHQTPVDAGLDYPSANPELYHHRYYNPPEDTPTSRIKPPYNYYSTDRKNHAVGMLPPLYKNNQFFYDDSSAVDTYEDYETYVPSTSDDISTPAATRETFTSSSTPRSSSSGSSGTQFFGERMRLPSYNQQRATSTPKYKYAYINNRPSVQSKLTTERTSTTGSSSDFRPLAQFPFNLPTNQASVYNLGIKLSGCNVVGKMYSVGDIIDELSSNCVRCMCSNIGVHCAELPC